VGRTGVSIPPFAEERRCITFFSSTVPFTLSLCSFAEQSPQQLKIAVTLGAAEVKRTRARRFRDQQDPPGILALIPNFYYAREMPRHRRANLRMSGLEGDVRITDRGLVLSPDEGKTRIYFERRSKFSLTLFVWRRLCSRSGGLGRGNRHCRLRLC